MDPITDAQDLVTARFPAARAAFLGGSVLAPWRTATSDLDVVVVLAGPPAPFRESLRWRDWPVDLFVHDERTLAAYFGQDVARRQPVLPRMCATGVTLTDRGGLADRVRDRAREILNAGPAPLSPAEQDERRYLLSDLLADLEGSDDPAETALIAWQVVVAAAQLALLLAGRWLGRGKWLLRELRDHDPLLADRLVAARDDPPRLTALAQGVLASAGGELWAGYRVAAARAPSRPRG